MVNLKIQEKNNINFEASWELIIENATLSLGLNKSEKERVKNAPAAKLLAALPFYAKSNNPDQLAVLKIGMYIMGYRNPVLFAHRTDQSIRERLLPGTYCPGGDPAVIDMVM